MKIKALLFTMFLTVGCYSQSLELSFYSTGSGRNISLDYLTSIERSEVSFGLGYNIGSIIQPDNQNEIYSKRLFPQEAIHFINLHVSYSRYIYEHKGFSTFLFFDIQGKYSPTRSELYLVYEYDSTIGNPKPEENLLYQNVVRNFGPFFWLENSLGIGIKFSISESIYIKQRIGLGYMLVFGEDKRLATQSPTGIFFDIFSFGIGMKLKENSD